MLSTVLKLPMFYLNVRHSRVVSHMRTSSHSQMFFTIGALKNFAIFTGKHPYWSLFFINFVGLETCTFIIKRLQHRCFSLNIAKFLRTNVFIKHFRLLLLHVFYKEAVPKNFVNFTRTCRYRSPFL